MTSDNQTEGLEGSVGGVMRLDEIERKLALIEGWLKAEQRAHIAEERVKVLENTLKFYADEGRYSRWVGWSQADEVEYVDFEPDSVIADEGKKARQALAALHEHEHEHAAQATPDATGQGEGVQE